MDEPFTRMPNRLLRSKKLDSVEKIVWALIESCFPSFPSYDALMEWSGASRGKIWSSLRRLESLGVISRYKYGRKVVYSTFVTALPERFSTLEPVHYMNPTVHQVNPTSSPDELLPVHQVNPKKNKEKEQLKRTIKKEFKEVFDKTDREREQMERIFEVLEDDAYEP